MAQFLTLILVLLFFAAFNPIVCPSSKMYNGRRDRAPYIESNENSPQYLADTGGTVSERFRKGNAKLVSQTKNSPSNTQQESADSLVNENIRKVFSTNFGPGLHLFNNTASYINQPHINSYNDQMVDDQPEPNTSPSVPSRNDMDFFKVQRSPEGKLSLVYNDDYVTQMEKNKTNINGSNKDSRVQTHFSDGLPLKKDNLTTTLPTANNTRSNNNGVIYFPTEEPVTPQQGTEDSIDDCLDNDKSKSDKVFCSHLRSYPEESRLEDLIKKKYSKLESFFGEDLVLPVNISQRMNNAPNEEFLCRSRVRVIYPQSGQNKDYNWLYIVNLSNYKQGIRIEECIEPGTTCGQNTGLTLPDRFTATCEQSYIYRTLVAYSNETIIKDTFRVPSCCKCVLRSY